MDKLEDAGAVILAAGGGKAEVAKLVIRFSQPKSLPENFKIVLTLKAGGIPSKAPVLTLDVGG